MDADLERWSERRAAILSAAQDSFLRRGFKATSLDDIIAKTGGSRRNIYTLFGDKEGLFEAVMREVMSGLLDRFGSVLSDDLPPEQWLHALGVTFVTGMTERETVNAFRQFIAIAGERPDLGKDAYEHGPATLYDKVARYLDAQTSAGRLDVEEPRRAAELFVEMVKGDFQLRALLLGTQPTPEEVEAHVARAVRVFLNGISHA